MNLNTIINLAKTFLPADSTLVQKMEQAKNIASSFSQSPEGVQQLMNQFGKSRTDIQNALNMLNNPLVSGMINKIQPNLVDQLRNAGNQFLSSNQNNNYQQSQNTMMYNQQQNFNNISSVNSSLDNLRNKLKNL